MLVSQQNELLESLDELKVLLALFLAVSLEVPGADAWAMGMIEASFPELIASDEDQISSSEDDEDHGSTHYETGLPPDEMSSLIQQGTEDRSFSLA